MAARHSPLATWLRRGAKTVVWLGGIAAFVALWNYASDAHTRHRRMPDCDWTLEPNTANTPYVAYWCKLSRDTAVIRVYDATEKKLLAERAYRELDLPLVYWKADSINYLVEPDGARIALPPTLLERLRAKLP